MSTVQELVIGALGAMSYLDINEEAPSPIVMTRSISILERMLASWEALDLKLATQVVSCRTVQDSPILYDVTTTRKLAPCLNVSGTGVTGRVLTIDGERTLTLDTDATASGVVDVTFTALPFPPKFEKAIVAMLAIDLAPVCQVSEIPEWVKMAAAEGWNTLSANYMPVHEPYYDNDLILTSSLRDVGVLIGNG